MAPKTERPPVPNPYAIDYAPTDRATCKGCDGRIGLDSLRFIRKVWSRFHDGFDELKYHLRCGKKFTDNLEEIRYTSENASTIPARTVASLVFCTVYAIVWQALRWSDILRVAKSFNTTIDEEHPAVQAVKRRSDAIWSLKALLVEIPKKQLLPILDANGIPYNEKKISVGEAAHIVADGFMFGRFPPCPICGNSALVQDEAKRIPVFKKWKCPEGVEGCMELGNPLSAPSPKAPKNEQSSSEPEAIPPGKELVGLSFTSVGATDPPKAELQLLIEKHAGEYTEQPEGRTTFLLVGDGDSHEFTKKYRDAKAAGVPIVHCSFVKALIRRKNVEPKLKLAECRKWKGLDDGPDPRPMGLLLRKKKYAQYYLVEGKLTLELPSAAESLKQLREARAKDKSRTKRPPIAKGSPLLQVDPLFSNKGGQIYVDQYGNAFNCCTQFTDISTGINKYYSMQIVQTNKTYHFFTKWGRLGADDKLTNDYKQQSFGQDVDAAVGKLTAQQLYTSCCLAESFPLRRFAVNGKFRNSAIYVSPVDAFESKFMGLTGTQWSDRFNFVQQPGRYGFVELAGYEVEDGATQEPKLKRAKLEAASASSTVAECTLPPAVKTIVELIFDRKLAEKLLTEQHLNLQKLPIDSISKRQLQEGYAVLQEIQNLLREDSEKINTLKHQTRLADATNRFYIKIPHIFSHAEKPPVLDSLAKLRTKIEMMEQLLENFGDLPLPARPHPSLVVLQISIAQSLLTDAMLNARDKHPLDAQYEQLRCKLEPLPENHEERKLVERLVSDTHAPTHNTWKLKIQSVLKCDRQGETERFNKDVDNRMLLWHGSRLTNWPSILAKGLQVAPPEAPSSGYMFDKGIYFADMVSKSSQYCFASSLQPHGLLVLCEAALGRQRQLLEADYEAAAKCKSDGQDSVHGVGRMCPNPDSDFEIPSVIDGKPVRVCGGKSWNNTKAVEELKANTPGSPEAALMYNEYVIYDPRQIKIRYLIHVEFEFASFDLDSI
ncbi:NAD(+) ADP-ribosyltransferase, putative [Eimeria acervulina]|uniref:Poly [ADP-ribose] polymerase n=1 Tax=Eimeria acervulina TaxID=5801 RepID=U6GRJ9_EIMAC|nr:NAD(+) ADP-ribosyltransferase, putative [Eimeria acervulina]CDI81883.1 NAD(+) ADP-ribosyltransferase, putative [Eimeria acervulina]